MEERTNYGNYLVFLEIDFIFPFKHIIIIIKQNEIGTSPLEMCFCILNFHYVFLWTLEKMSMPIKKEEKDHEKWCYKIPSSNFAKSSVKTQNIFFFFLLIRERRNFLRNMKLIARHRWSAKFRLIFNKMASFN